MGKASRRKQQRRNKIVQIASFKQPAIDRPIVSKPRYIPLLKWAGSDAGRMNVVMHIAELHQMAARIKASALKHQAPSLREWSTYKDMMAAVPKASAEEIKLFTHQMIEKGNALREGREPKEVKWVGGMPSNFSDQPAKPPAHIDPVSKEEPEDKQIKEAIKNAHWPPRRWLFEYGQIGMFSWQLRKIYEQKCRELTKRMEALKILAEGANTKYRAPQHCRPVYEPCYRIDPLTGERTLFNADEYELPKAGFTNGL